MGGVTSSSTDNCNCTSFSVGIITPLARERSHVMLVSHIYENYNIVDLAASPAELVSHLAR